MPQLFGSLAVLVSQPFDVMLPSQSPHPASQVPVQVPDVQVLFATWFDEQYSAQEPQLFGSVLRFVSQPFDLKLLSQSPHPASQLPAQLPAVQVLLDMWFDEQAAAQEP
jgi:hypothetical protein